MPALVAGLRADADEGGPGAEEVEELLLVSTSMGGARPKTVVEDDEGLWLAKFNRPDDKWNVARVEHAMLELAAECGVRAAVSRLVTVAGRDVLLVKRFDRQKTSAGYLRARMVSALTLLRADELPNARGRWSYLELVEALRRASATAGSSAFGLPVRSPENPSPQPAGPQRPPRRPSRFQLRSTCSSTAHVGCC